MHISVGKKIIYLLFLPLINGYFTKKKKKKTLANDRGRENAGYLPLPLSRTSASFSDSVVFRHAGRLLLLLPAMIPSGQKETYIMYIFTFVESNEKLNLKEF